MDTIPVVILCGGMGTRLAEQTEVRPKPLVEIGGRPILWHIMKHYSYYGFNEFILALGYKGEQIKRYFLDYNTLSSDFTVSLSTGQVRQIARDNRESWVVHLHDTGLKTETGGRLAKLGPLLSAGTFMLTYGDGVSNVNLQDLLSYHRQRGSAVTLTAVRPPARFGAIELHNGCVESFSEKPALREGWINGGFFVVEPQALHSIEGNVPWERRPLEQLAAKGQLHAFQHDGFWQCMDTMRDVRLLEKLWRSGNPPWKLWT